MGYLTNTALSLFLLTASLPADAQQAEEQPTVGSGLEPKGVYFSSHCLTGKNPEKGIEGQFAVTMSFALSSDGSLSDHRSRIETAISTAIELRVQESDGNVEVFLADEEVRKRMEGRLTGFENVFRENEGQRLSIDYTVAKVIRGCKKQSPMRVPERKFQGA